MRRLLLPASLLLIASCSRERTNVAVDAALLTQVPGDSVALGAMRVKALRGTTAWKKLLEQKGVNESLDKFASQTSFDPRKDLWEILWSTNGKDVLVYARGEFAPMGLEPKIDRPGVQRLNYKGAMLLGDDENAVWFVNSSTAVFGRTLKIHELIDTRDTRKPGPSATLRERIDALPPNAHLWLVADAAAIPKMAESGPSNPRSGEPVALNFLQNLPKLLQTIKTTAIHANLTDGVALEAVAYCDSETGAKQVHDSLRGLTGLARFSLPEKQRAAFMPLLDSIEVTHKQAAATLRARITSGQFEQIQATLPPSGPSTRPAD